MSGEKAPRDPRGVLFVATGERYIECARAAAESVKRHMPDLPIALASDRARLGLARGASGDPFSYHLDIADGHRRSKVDQLARTPFERTVFLDADIRVLHPIDDLFDLLDQFDIAMAHAHTRNRDAVRVVWRVSLPDAFPQYNTGVIAYRMTDAMQTLLDDWREAYHSAGFRKDQVTMRELLWHGNVRLAALPPEYNFRSAKYFVVWGRREAIPRIAHFARFSHPSTAGWLKESARQRTARAILPVRNAVRSVAIRLGLHRPGDD